MNHLNLEEFERKIAYTFSDKNLLILALTHSSYANETKKGSHENNERLEFLGDAVLDMVVSEYMYRHFPKMPEGELTKLRAAVVCEAKGHLPVQVVTSPPVGGDRAFGALQGVEASEQ